MKSAIIQNKEILLWVEIITNKQRNTKRASEGTIKTTIMMLDLVKIKMVDRSADQFCQNIQTTYLSDIYIAIITGESAQNQISIKHNNKSFFFSDWGLPTLKRHTGSKEVSPLGRPSFEFSSTFEFEEEEKRN